MVIDRGAFLSGRYAQVYDEIVQVKEACGDAHLKVILETGELGTYDNVRRASLLAIAAGADFIKTSTGKLSGAATLPVALVMLEAIRDVYEETGRVVGFKPAGGIRTAKQAIQHLVLVDETLGADWLTPDRYRLGASSLLNDVLMQIRFQRTGRYPAPTTSPSTDGRARRDATRTRSAAASSTRPRPSRATSSRLAASLRALRRRRVRRARAGERFATHRPRHRGAARGGRAGRRGGRRPAVARRPRGLRRALGAMRPAERAKYLFRIARILQERSREFAVLESLNGGKPIKESRDVDLPLAAAHFFYYAGWADKLEYAFPNARPRPLGVAAQVIPWNFPLLMLAWKVAPALAAGNTVVLKPAETTPLTALLFADVVRQAELPPGVVNIVTGDGRTGAALVRHPDVDKVAFTGSTEVGKAIQRELAGTRQGADAGARRQGGQHRVRRRRDRPGRRGHRQRHLLQPGPRLLRRLAPAGAGVRRRATSWTSWSAVWRRCASATPSTRTPTSARSTRGSSSSASRSSCGRARRGRRDLPVLVPRSPSRGYCFPPTIFTNVAQSYRIAQEEIFGPVLTRAHVPHARGGGREGEQHAVRPLRGHLDREGLAHPVDGRSACAPASSGPTPSTASTPRRRSAATRSRASAARAGCTA